MVYDLTEWACVRLPCENPYAAPETYQTVYLTGKCPARASEVSRTGNPEHVVTTSRVVKWDPATRIATTNSGTRYRLVGPPEAGFKKWCDANGIDIDKSLGWAS